jgi:hypothetical protein
MFIDTCFEGRHDVRMNATASHSLTTQHLRVALDADEALTGS